MPAVNGESTIQKLPDAKAAHSGFGLPLPTFLPRRYKPRNVGSWSGHLAFANDLILAIEPSLIVELGTHWGEAYFTFCQTVQEHGLSSLCYAVDHWLGDEHAGRYGEEVFEEVREYNQRYYQQFSYLLRSSFDDAVSQFGDSSIGLLHIDGLHTYEAARHDFDTWLPKVKPGGTVLLHDICAKHQDFGVWRLWDELKTEFADTFEFHHSWGLGVVRKEGEASPSPLTEGLFSSSPSVREEVRRRYVVYSSHLENLLDRASVAAASETAVQAPDEIRVQVFPFGATGYSEETSLLQKISPGAWHTLTFELPEAIGDGPLRIDPANEPCVIEISELLIHSRPSGDLLWSAFPLSDPPSVVTAGTATLLSSENGSFLISFDNDPQLIVGVPPNIGSERKLTISLRVSPAPMPVPEILEAVVKTAQTQLAAVQTECDAAQLECDAARLERDRTLLACNTTVLECNAKINDLTRAIHDLSRGMTESKLERDKLADTLSRAVNEKRTTEKLLLAAESGFLHEQTTRMSMQRSLSWRVTEPIRKLMTSLRSGPRKAQ